MFLPDDIINVILLFVSEFELVDWILMNKLNWNCLSVNPAAIHLLEEHQKKIFWNWLSQNSAAIYLLEQNKDKINRKCLFKKSI